jgi:hypothetical protein
LKECKGNLVGAFNDTYLTTFVRAEIDPKPWPERPELLDNDPLIDDELL